MKLFFIILATVLFAFGVSLFSNYYKYKIYKKISVAISVFFVLSFYYFLSTNLFHPEIFNPTKNLIVYTPTGNYYNLVLNAFKKGNLYISDSIKYPTLKEKDIYKNFPIYVKKDMDLLSLLDTSYYNNKIYFYFGITPVLLFYAPFNLITGLFLTDKSLVFVLSSFIFILSLFIIKVLIKKIIKKKMPFHIDILIIFLIGFCNYLPFLLIRSSSYEVAITAAAFFLFLCLYLFLIHNKNSYFSLFFIGLLIALSVGCRPHYILFIPLLIITIISIEIFKKTDIKTISRLILVFTLPCILYSSLLALYNYLRFDSIVEFGRTYQLNELNQSNWHFKIQDLLIGIKYNLFQSPVINNNFPVFSLELAKGHSIGNEFIAGVFYIFPLALILLLFPFMAHTLWKRDRKISIFLIALTFISILNLFIDTSAAGIVQRYIFEYLYLGVLISIIIFYYLYTNTQSVLMKYLLNIFFITVYVFSIYINISLLFCYENSLFYTASSNGNYEKIIRFLS
jgi:hypothetical protein